MFRPSGIKWNLTVASFLAATSLLMADVERHPTSLGMAMDLGQIVSGQFVDATPSDTIRADGQFLSRTGLYITESATFNERFTVTLTLGGLFFFAFPEKSEEGLHRFPQLGGGPEQAQGVYRFGDPEESFAQLQFGLFPIKYTDAHNLGEYLYRSGIYPTLLYSGGWSYFNSAHYMAQGVRFSLNHAGGAVKHDFSLTFERDYAPNYNLSPTYLLTVSLGSIVEIGGGVMWAHGIPLQDSLLSPRNPQNAYVKATGLPLIYRDSTGQKGLAHYRSDDPRVRPDNDSCLVFGDPCYDPTFVSESRNGIPGEELGFYTFKGVKLMGRIAVDLGAAMDMEESNFKIYGEGALLGVANQPFFYEDRSERIPLMAGITLPTFGILDALSFEVEYFKSRFPNNLNTVFNKKWPLPLRDENLDPWIYNMKDPAYLDPDHPDFQWLSSDVDQTDTLGFRKLTKEQFQKDDWRWSVYAKKEIREGFGIVAQVASDHQRQILFSDYAPKFMDFPTTRYTKDWYYVVRLEVGL